MRRLAFGLLALSAIGCAADSFSPSLDNMAGTYYATSLTVTDAGGMHDILAAGGSHITLTLMSNGTVGGSMLIKGGNEDGSDFAADMVGTWQLANGEITFNQTADTFVRDATFRAGKGSLSSDLTTADGTVHVTMAIGTYVPY